MNQRVSIIIPCFNAARFLAEAVESALAQSHRDVEVIVIDDGSTDGSLDVIRSFGNRIHWETGPNRGACAARNRGLAIASGEFVQFLDADDLLHHDKIRKQLEFLHGRERALVFCMQHVMSLDPQTTPAVKWNRQDTTSDAIAFMLRGDLQTAAPLHRMRIVKEIGGFREDLPCAQDRDFHLRLALSNVEFHAINEELLTVRRRPGSIGTSNPSRVEEYRGRIALEVWEELLHTGRSTEVRAIECAAMLTRSARQLYLANPALADQFAAEAKRIHPTAGEHLAYSTSMRLTKAIMGCRNAERMRIVIRQLQLAFGNKSSQLN